MAYENPKTGRIYLSMKMAPVCIPDIEGSYACHKCPVRKIGELHGYKNLNACDEICMSYGDEVAEAIGYNKITYSDEPSEK